MRVFYDGACSLCAREMRYYRAVDKAGHLEFINIADPEFSAAAFGLDDAEVHKKMHAKAADGQVYTAVDAFRMIWQALGYERTAALSRLPGINFMLKTGYTIFARNRHWLTGRCADDACRVD